MSLHTKFKQPL